MNDLDVITLIDALVYCLEDSEQLIRDWESGEGGFTGCDQCPGRKDRTHCQLETLLHTYNEWKSNYENSLRR